MKTLKEAIHTAIENGKEFERRMNEGVYADQSSDRSPPPPPSPPRYRSIEEGAIYFCPKCGSSLRRNLFGYSGKCIQPECENYYGGKQKMSNTKKACETCSHWDSHDNGTPLGYCRRRSPITGFPVLNKDEWCGEWCYSKAKEREREREREKERVKQELI